MYVCKNDWIILVSQNKPTAYFCKWSFIETWSRSSDCILHVALRHLGYSNTVKKDSGLKKLIICHLTLHRKLSNPTVDEQTQALQWAVSGSNPDSHLFLLWQWQPPKALSFWEAGSLKTDQGSEGEWPAEFLNRIRPLTWFCSQPPHTAVGFSKEGCWAAPGLGLSTLQEVQALE